jgi:uncharacterized protein YheU (UPF0270 family)
MRADEGISHRDHRAVSGGWMDDEKLTEVPYTQLAPEVLRRLVEEFVTRDGTDYGEVEKSLDDKVAAVLRQLERGEALIVFDREAASVNIVPATEPPA